MQLFAYSSFWNIDVVLEVGRLVYFGRIPSVS